MHCVRLPAGTIWDVDSVVQEESPPLPSKLFHDIGGMFAAKPSAAAKKGAAVGATPGLPKQTPKANLLEGGLARNMGITLAKFGRIAWSDLAARILCCDVDYFGGQDKIRMLLDLNCFDANIVKSVANFKDDVSLLDTAEKFILEVVVRVPRVYEKLSCMEFCCKLEEFRASILDPIARIRNACAEVWAACCSGRHPLSCRPVTRSCVCVCVAAIPLCPRCATACVSRRCCVTSSCRWATS